MDSLQIPDNTLPGPSRQNGAPRPASVSTAATPLAPPPQSSRKRASHTVASSTHPDEQHQQQQQHQPPFRDIYSHPAAIQYAASHPRRAIPKFGPYLLLQTLGEGEFGKVKLGLHTTWAEEVAVKLIKRNNIDSALRMSKVEREIEVLRVRRFSLPSIRVLG
jgi:protein-serine/threonine kinase